MALYVGVDPLPELVERHARPVPAVEHLGLHGAEEAPPSWSCPASSPFATSIGLCRPPRRCLSTRASGSGSRSQSGSRGGGAHGPWSRRGDQQQDKGHREDGLRLPEHGQSRLPADAAMLRLQAPASRKAGGEVGGLAGAPTHGNQRSLKKYLFYQSTMFCQG